MWESERVETTSGKNLRTQYTTACQKYEDLAKNLKQALEIFLNDAGIDVLDVHYRIKDFESFVEKMQRKGYKDPFQDTEDICGLRIICYYHSDLDRISSLINREFNVLESVDKEDLLGTDEFGYRSIHFIVTVKNEWLSAPNYRGLDGLKAEIQARTVLMHAWADIQHKLAYKKKEYVPKKLERKLSRLSAIFEEADEQLDSLQKEREEYREDLLSEDAKRRGRFDVTQPMNIDSLQAFLDFYFWDREKYAESTSHLLDRIMKYGISIRDLVDAYERVRDVLPNMEKEYFEAIEPVTVSGKVIRRKWTQVQAVEKILSVTQDNYWRDIRKRVREFYLRYVEKWRDKLSKQ